MTDQSGANESQIKPNEVKPGFKFKGLLSYLRKPEQPTAPAAVQPPVPEPGTYPQVVVETAKPEAAPLQVAQTMGKIPDRRREEQTMPAVAPQAEKRVDSPELRQTFRDILESNNVMSSEAIITSYPFFLDSGISTDDLPGLLKNLKDRGLFPREFAKAADLTNTFQSFKDGKLVPDSELGRKVAEYMNKLMGQVTKDFSIDLSTAVQEAKGIKVSKLDTAVRQSSIAGHADFTPQAMVTKNMTIGDMWIKLGTSDRQLQRFMYEQMLNQEMRSLQNDPELDGPKRTAILDAMTKRGNVFSPKWWETL